MSEGPRVTDREIAAVLSLPGNVRYDRFIKTVADWETAWGLFDAGWALLGTQDGEAAFALWPTKEYANLCATGEWASYSPRDIQLDDLVETLIPKLTADGVLVVVFSTPEDRGVVTEPSALANDLEAASAEYE